MLFSCMNPDRWIISSWPHCQHQQSRTTSLPQGSSDPAGLESLPEEKNAQKDYRHTGRMAGEDPAKIRVGEAAVNCAKD